MNFYPFNFTELKYFSFQNWCSKYSDEKKSFLNSKDVHSLTYVRVTETLKNSKEFSNTWNCPKGSKMNPEKKCYLWGKED